MGDQGNGGLAQQSPGAPPPPNQPGFGRLCTAKAPPKAVAAPRRSIELCGCALIIATIKANGKPLRCCKTAHNLFTSTARAPGIIGLPRRGRKALGLAKVGARRGCSAKGRFSQAPRLLPLLPRRAPAAARLLQPAFPWSGPARPP